MKKRELKQEAMWLLLQKSRKKFRWDNETSNRGEGRVVGRGGAGTAHKVPPLSPPWRSEHFLLIHIREVGHLISLTGGSRKEGVIRSMLVQIMNA